MTVNLYRDNNCNAIVHLKDGTTIGVATDQIHNKNLHHWEGWLCNVGVDSIFIDNDFTVYAGSCRNDKLGNLFTKDFSLFDSPTVCKQKKCTSCTSDLFSTKFKG